MFYFFSVIVLSHVSHTTYTMHVPHEDEMSMSMSILCRLCAQLTVFEAMVIFILTQMKKSKRAATHPTKTMNGLPLKPRCHRGVG
jgi:hypothetical protein